MRLHHWPLITCLMMAVLLAHGCRRFAARMGVTYVPFTTVSGEQDVSAEVTQLNVGIRAGELRVVGGVAEHLEVEADVKIKESLANPDADRGTFADHVRIEMEGDTLTIEDAHTGQPDEKDWRVSLVLHVPAGLAVNLRTGAGRIAVEGMTSDIRANSGAGEITIRSTTVTSIMADTGAGEIDIRVDGVAGPVTANAAAGAVRFRAAQNAPLKDVVLTAAVGDVLLAIPPGAPGAFELKADVGRVSVSGHDGIEVERSGLGARGRGTVGEGGPRYKVETGAGSIRVQ